MVYFNEIRLYLSPRSVLAILIISLTMCAVEKPEATVDLSYARGFCKNFTFPGWHIRSTTPEFGYVWWRGSADLEFRKGLANDVFLLRLRYGFGSGERTYSDELWKIEWADDAKPTAVSDTDWRSAAILNEPLHWWVREERYSLMDHVDERSVSLNGYTLPSLGETWALRPPGVLHSPDREFVILQSLTGPYTPTSDKRLGDYYQGTAFVQVYNLKSGKELFRVTGRWKNQGLSAVFGNTEWIDSRTILISFDPNLMKGVVLCRIEE